MSVDGVSEAKSTSVSMDVFSTKFKNCRHVYPLRIIRPLNNNKVDDDEQLESVLDDCYNEANIAISHCVADKPKRSKLLKCKNQNAKFPCEYCFGEADVHSDLRHKTLSKKIKQQLSFLDQRINEIHDKPNPTQKQIKEKQTFQDLKEKIMCEDKK